MKMKMKEMSDDAVLLRSSKKSNDHHHDDRRDNNGDLSMLHHQASAGIDSLLKNTSPIKKVLRGTRRTSSSLVSWPFWISSRSGTCPNGGVIDEQEDQGSSSSPSSRSRSTPTKRTPEDEDPLKYYNCKWVSLVEEDFDASNSVAISVAKDDDKNNGSDILRRDSKNANYCGRQSHQPRPSSRQSSNNNSNNNKRDLVLAGRQGRQRRESTASSSSSQPQQEGLRQPNRAPPAIRLSQEDKTAAASTAASSSPHDAVLAANTRRNRSKWKNHPDKKNRRGSFYFINSDTLWHLLTTLVMGQHQQVCLHCRESLTLFQEPAHVRRGYPYADPNVRDQYLHKKPQVSSNGSSSSSNSSLSLHCCHTERTNVEILMNDVLDELESIFRCVNAAQQRANKKHQNKRVSFFNVLERGRTRTVTRHHHHTVSVS